jgi:hypothetical protein
MFLFKNRLPSFKLLKTVMVCGTQLSMDDAAGMEVLQGVDDLDHVALHLDFRQPLPPLDQLIQCLV